MSQRRISLSSDLSRLRADGYDVSEEHGHLVMRDVPYVNPQREVKRCTLIDILNVTGDDVGRPPDHTMWAGGERPCDQHGIVLERIFAQPDDHNREIVPGVSVNWRLSAKAMADGNQRVEDTEYHAKFLRYVEVLSAPAKLIDANATAQTFPVVTPDAGDNSIFKYIDTASARAGIVAISQKLELGRVAIVGLGGSGSYILDLVAKTPVREIHIFDPDVFSQHNAFRFPGAASVDDLKAKPSKVAYLSEVYGKMRSGIVPHPEGIATANVGELARMNFVFLALDGGDAKRLAVETLRRAGIPFVECGMGLYQVDQKLAGVLRLTTGTETKQDHLNANIPYSDGNVNNEYAQNLQIADLNALSAALAVIRWKKLFGFYNDLDREHHSTYTVDGNALSNGEYE